MRLLTTCFAAFHFRRIALKYGQQKKVARNLSDGRSDVEERLHQEVNGQGGRSRACASFFLPYFQFSIGGKLASHNSN
jgi:hypothetical protein